MAERTGSPTATYEALLGRARLQSLQYDVAQAGKLRGQRDNYMTRMQGLDKQLYSFEHGKSFGRGGGWAAWFQAMNGVIKIQAGETQHIRGQKTKLRTALPHEPAPDRCGTGPDRAMAYFFWEMGGFS